MQNLFWNNRIFSLKSGSPKLPVEWNGEERWVAWKGYMPIEQMKRGEWSSARPTSIKILATRAQSGGVWFQVKQGLQGFLLRDSKGKPVVYILTAPSTHYFKTMTGVTRMPVLVGQVI